MEKTKQIQAWTGEFGRDYLARCGSIDEVEQAQRTQALAGVVAAIPDKPASILEVGTNVGKNLLSLAELTDAALYGVEPFAEAYQAMVANVGPRLAGSANCSGLELPFADGSFDLSFTSGVLIHVSPDDLPRMMGEIVRVSRRYVWVNEYFAKSPEALSYRNKEGLLFKRDFGRYYMELFPALKPVATGFLWSAVSPFDDTVWWLFDKTA